MAGGANSENFGSLDNLVLSFGVLLFILILNRYARGFVKSLAVLLGIIVGTLIAAIMGKVNFASVQEASWFVYLNPFTLDGLPLKSAPLLQ